MHYWINSVNSQVKASRDICTLVGLPSFPGLSQQMPAWKNLHFAAVCQNWGSYWHCRLAKFLIRFYDTRKISRPGRPGLKLFRPWVDSIYLKLDCNENLNSWVKMLSQFNGNSHLRENLTDLPWLNNLLHFWVFTNGTLYRAHFQATRQCFHLGANLDNDFARYLLCWHHVCFFDPKRNRQGVFRIKENSTNKIEIS